MASGQMDVVAMAEILFAALEFVQPMSEHFLFAAMVRTLLAQQLSHFGNSHTNSFCSFQCREQNLQLRDSDNNVDRIYNAGPY